MFYSFPEDFQKVIPKTGLSMYQISGEKLMLSLAMKDYDPDTQSGAAHSHDLQEKIMIVLRGEVSFTVGDEVRVCKPMDAVIIPPGVMHSTDPGLGESEVLQVFSLPYKDYETKLR